MPSNKDAATEFLRMAASGKAEEAGERFLGPGFKHHNPYFPAGEAILEAMDENARQFPEKTFEVLRAIQDGDLVALHSKVRMRAGTPWIAVVHIFRFQAGRIVELWDIGQQAPPDSPNVDGMF